MLINQVREFFAIMHGLHRTYQMKTYLLNFCLGALIASSQFSWLILFQPFLLLYISVFYRAYFKSALFFLLGMVWVFIHLMHSEASAYPEDMAKYKSVIEGRVESVSKGKQKIDFDFITQEGKIKASCYRCPLNLQSGDYWALELRIKPIISLHNPNGFNYRQWMLAKGYFSSASVIGKSINNLRLLVSTESVKQKIETIITRDNTPIVRALLLGDKQALKAEDRRVINLVGISHLFVVSGLHISLLAMLVIGIFSFVQRPLLVINWRYGFVLSLLLGVLCAGIYAWVSGFNVPALRALLMLFCGIILIWGQRTTSVLTYWLMALLLVLVIAPLSFFDLGSWLSFGIVLALILGMSGSSFDGLQDKTNRKVNSLYITGNWALKLIRTQWLAFCFGGGILALFGFQVSLVSILLNLLLIPIMSLVMVPMAFTGLLLALIGEHSLLMFCENLLTDLLSILQVLGDFFVGQIPLHEQNRSIMALAFILAVMPKAFNLTYLAIGLLVVGLFVQTGRPALGGFSVVMLDVGQGSSAVIETNGHTMVVDTGYGATGRLGMTDYVVTPYLKYRDIQSIDKLFLTHNDADHAGGYNQLKKISSETVRQENCEDESWYWDDVYFQQFQSSDYQIGNNGTCLLRVTAREGGSILFTGDIERKAEKSLLMSHSGFLAADVIVVPHHGSKSSSGSDFINAVNPSVALISAGRLNHFGHPHDEVLTRYKDRLVEIYSTASHGAVEVVFSPRQAARIVSTYRPNDSYK